MTAKTQTRAKLLLVDDDPSMVRLLAKVIERQLADTIEIGTLTDPTDARVMLEEGEVDILITDLEMPGISGLELLKCAKRRNQCTQVIFVTGNSTRDALLDALEIGASDYLLKPIDQTELVEVLKQALERGQRWKDALLGTWRSGAEKKPVVTA